MHARSRPEQNAPAVGSSTTGLSRYGDMACASPTDYPPSIEPASTVGVCCSMHPPVSLGSCSSSMVWSPESEKRKHLECLPLLQGRVGVMKG
eukprot:1095927-Rhodomonas_salina.1